jgi:adenylate/nucleoside-diphosphate kinase
MQGPGYPTYPAIYRNYIYFMATSQNRDTFMHDPMTYLKQSSPKPVVPIRLAIIGPPKSGKTTCKILSIFNVHKMMMKFAVAKRFAEEFGLLRFSIGEAVRSVIENQPKSALVRAMNAFLYRGRTIPDELQVQCLEVALLNMQCQTRGYVLDGYPLTKNQVDLMTQRSLIPVRVLDLTVNSKELVTRATIDRYSAEK